MKTRLCIVSPLYHPSVGGPGRQSVALAEKLFTSGVSVIVFCRKMIGLPPYPYDSRVKVYRLPAFFPQQHVVETLSARNLLIPLSFSIFLIAAFVRRRREYDIAHFFGAGLPLLLSLPVLTILGKTVTATVLGAGHGDEAGSLRSRYFLLGILMTGMLKKVDCFVAMSEEIEQALLAEGFRKAQIIRIPNWVDTSRFRPAEPSEKKSLKEGFVSEEVSVALFAGRLTPVKGVPYLLEAWKEIAERHPGSILLIAGEGKDRKHLLELCEELGLEEKVRFLGHVNTIETYLKAADIFVLPSLQEGMPNTLLEAMACSLPPVATRIGGVVDVVQDGENGILVEAGNSASLAGAVEGLLADPGRADRIGRAAASTIAEHFSLDAAVEKYLALYSRLLGETGKLGRS